MRWVSIFPIVFYLGSVGELKGLKVVWHILTVNQVLECREGVIHQLILQRVNQASQETVLSLGVGVDIFGSIARQLQKPVPILTDRR